MEVFVFSGVGAFGFTRDRNGANLPAEFGPWKFRNSVVMNAGEGQRIGVNTEECLADIARQGFHVTNAKIVIERSGQ